MVDSHGCWKLSRWKYRWVNILDLINMTPQWWIARGAGNCLDGSTARGASNCHRWKYQWVNILRLTICMTPQWWIARGAGNCLRWKDRSKIDMYWAIRSGTLLLRLGKVLCVTPQAGGNGSCFPVGRKVPQGCENPNIQIIHDQIPQISAIICSDPLYFHVEKVESYAWVQESPKSMEK
ncbi:hypothetical protein E3N88_15262 [Mikania micrantha]|uniref:Uncharacterized protein n=1 Tax=Mikania micrantha TaxID=192012 RepID=A0A5N6NVJ8_9ASTR|nr:hypothetical protein E3N88_15262 [Mikania micrantha]